MEVHYRKQKSTTEQKVENTEIIIYFDAEKHLI